MFCIHCGKQLEDGTRFCVYCGGQQANVTPEVPPEIEMCPPGQTAPTPGPEIPVNQTPLNPVPNYEVPLAGTMPPDSQSDFVIPPVGGTHFEESARPDGDACSDAYVYADPVPPREKAPKKKKTGIVIALILVLVLLIGGGLGIYIHMQNVHEENLAAYEDAEILLKKKDYDGALEAFRALGDFDDAKEQVRELEALQEKYDDALTLLEEGAFDKAREAFRKLDDYRDSENYVKYEITYQEALHYMESEDMEYLQAAELFDTIADYSDSADQASACRLKLALALINEGNYDAAMKYTDQLNSADADSLRSAYGQVCADEAFLEDLENALVIWLDESDTLSYEEEISTATDILNAYAGAYFDDSGLTDIREEFLAALNTMTTALNSDGEVYDWATYYYGMYQLYSMCDNVYNDHGGLTDSQMRERFVGNSEIAYAYHVIEYSLSKWWDNVSEVAYDDQGYYVMYYNNTGYSFTLYTQVCYYNSSDVLVEVSNTRTVSVDKDGSVRISMEPDTIGDQDWQTCSLVWNFDSIS